MPTTPEPGAERVIITPPEAEEMLADNQCNRPIRQVRIDRFARDMSNDQWDLNGETVKLSDAGSLLDGQHRLLACIKADMPFETYLIRNLPRAAQRTVDTGAARTMGDQFVMEGEDNGHALAAVARWYFKWLRGIRLAASTSLEPTHPEMLALLRSEPRLRVAAGKGLAYRMQFKKVKPSTWAMGWLLLTTRDVEDAEGFLHRCATGVDCSEGAPELAFRNRIMNAKDAGEKMNAYGELAYLLAAWRHYRRGQTIGKLQAPKGGWTTRNYPEPI